MAYTIVGRSDLVAPACCFFFRTDTEEYYIDTGKTLDWEGAVYIGARALKEMAELAGYLDPVQVQKLVAINKELENALADCRASLADRDRILSPMLGVLAEQQGHNPDAKGSVKSGSKSNNRPVESDSVVIVASVPADSTGIDL